MTCSRSHSHRDLRNSQSSMFHRTTVVSSGAAMNPLTLLSCLLLCSVVQAAFHDFVIGPESHFGGIPSDEEQILDGDTEEETMVSFHDVQRDGVVDTSLLMRALLQYANRMGMSLDELAAMNMGGDDEGFPSQPGCSADQDDYQDGPTWRDVLFN